MPRKYLNALLALPVVLAATAFGVSACDSCTPDNKVVVARIADVTALPGAIAKPSPKPTELNVGCTTYVFQVAWHGYKKARSWYRIFDGPTPDHESNLVDIHTPRCDSGTCRAEARASSSKQADATLHIEPEDETHVQETAQAICKITMFASDGHILAIGYRQNGDPSEVCSAAVGVH
jgi:hypothetical protein